MSVGTPRSLLDGPYGPLEYLTLAPDRQPSTVFAHGLAGTIDTTRPFASAVAGSRTFFHFRGHGASHAPDGEWTYAALADELAAVCDHVGASRALGVSMGAGALCALLARSPERFERCVMVIPAAIDRPRRDRALERLVHMGRLVEERDVDGVTEVLVGEQPAEVRHDHGVVTWARRRAALLVGTPVSRALRFLPHAVPLPDRGALERVGARCLVVGQEDDDAHPAQVARELAEVLPDARLQIFPRGGVLWRHRAAMRDLISGFLNDPA